MALSMQPLYILSSGASRAMEQLDTVTNNLANANTTGFKKLLMREMSQGVLQNGGEARKLLTFPRFLDTYVALDQGMLKMTDNLLDLAINGDGFFAVEVQGKTLYTRNGHFAINADGFLVDSNGNFVLDADNKRITLDTTASVTIGIRGEIFQNGEEVARLGIKNFESFKPEGNSYYSPLGNEKDGLFRIVQGSLESSNINPVLSMAEMISAQRRFEIYGNLIKTLDGIEQKSNEIGRA